MSAKSADAMKADQDRVRKLLSETVVMLCKSGLRYEDQLEIKGVLAITIDKKDVFIVHIDDREVQGEIKSETNHASPCTTSEFDNQYYNGTPAKKMKVEDTSSYQEYSSNTSSSNAEQKSHSQTSSQGASAPQFFTDDIDNQTPLKNINIPQQNLAEPVKNVNQWALSIPSMHRQQTPMQTNTNNMLALQQQGMMMVARQRYPMHPNMNQAMRQPAMARMAMSQNPSTMRMMMQQSPSPQRFRMQQQTPMQRMPSPRGTTRGRGRGASRPEVMDPMGGKLSVDSKNIDGFSYGKQTVTQYICNICGVVYKNHSSLLTHQVKTHGRQKKAGVGRRPKHSEDYDEEDIQGMDGAYGYGEDEYDEDFMP